MKTALKRVLKTLPGALLLGGLISCTAVPKANLAIGQLNLGNPQKAWRMIRAELRKPTVSSPADLCDTHLAAIQILQSIITYDFAPSDPDDIAKRSYNYIRNHCGSFKKKLIIAENQYGLYFQNTRRPGLALPRFEQSLKLSPPGSFLNMVNEHNLALSFQDMGNSELRDYHSLKAIQIGNKYFKTRRVYKYGLDEFQQWNAYNNILQFRLDNLAWSGDSLRRLPEMRELWTQIASINGKWYSKPTQYLAYHFGSQRFAAAGDTQFARTPLDEAKRLTQKYPYKNRGASVLDLQSTEAQILKSEGKFEESAALFQDWIHRFHQVTGKSLQGNDYRLAGLAQEAAHRYDLAIDYLEKCINAYETRRKTFYETPGSMFSPGVFQKTTLPAVPLAAPVSPTTQRLFATLPRLFPSPGDRVF